jgi:aryl-alcohol dehydrogenase-like predicted oxidoreductase
MVEYHMNDESHSQIMSEAATRGVGVIVKKGLASGRLSSDEAIPFVLRHQNVASMVIGGLNLDHMRENISIASAMAST